MYKSSGEDSLFNGTEEETFSIKLKKFWTRTSLGGFAAPSNRFYESELSDIPKQMTLSCPKGRFSIDPDVAYYGLINEEEYAIYTMYMIDSTCNNEEVFSDEISKCEDETECDIFFDNSWFDSECVDNLEGQKKLYLKMYCKETTLELFGKTYTKEQYSLLIAGINIVTIVVYISYLLVLKVTESNLENHYEKKNSSPSDFALRLKNLPRGIGEQEMVGKLYDHFTTFAENNKIQDPIVDISVGQQNEMFMLNQKITKNDDFMSFHYEELKKKKYMKDKKLGEGLDVSQLRGIIDNLEDPKSKLTVILTFNRQEKSQRNFQKNPSIRQKKEKSYRP